MLWGNLLIYIWPFFSIIGFAAEWNMTWLSLSNRYLCYFTQGKLVVSLRTMLEITNKQITLYIFSVTYVLTNFFFPDGPEMDMIDLKKTRDIFLRSDSKNLNLPSNFAKQPVLVCYFNDRSLYILTGNEKVSSVRGSLIFSDNFVNSFLSSLVPINFFWFYKTPNLKAIS